MKAKAEDTNQNMVETVYSPVCMGVAVSATRIVTSSSCVFATDVHFEPGARVATLGDVSGENVSMRPDRPVSAWAELGTAYDGPSDVVRLRGGKFVTTQMAVTSDRLDRALAPGDAGAGVFQGGLLVGLVQACDDSNGDGVCETTGGRFSPAQ